MNKKLLSILTAVTVLSAASTANAFNNGDIINFKTGELSCLGNVGTPPSSCYYGTTVATGSYYAMDVNGNGQFDQRERVPMSSGSDGGIIIGAIQAASGSHTMCPDGSEVTPVDSAWCFFGNTGMHQTTVFPVLDNGDNTLDFRGWGVAWNGISNIPLGGDPVNFPGDTGLAAVTCVDTPCNATDYYEIDYTAHVPVGDPSNFGQVAYQLHLESDTPVPPTAGISVDILGGAIQQCAVHGGAIVTAESAVNVPDGDSVSSIEWSLDGNVISNNASIQQFVSLGSHTISASLKTTNGLAAVTLESVKVVDTSPSTVFAAFIDKKTGEQVSQILDESRVIIKAEAVDACDPSPVVMASIGAPVENGQKIKADQEDGKVKLHTPNLLLSVTATDAAGNSATRGARLIITE